MFVETKTPHFDYVEKNVIGRFYFSIYFYKSLALSFTTMENDPVHEGYSILPTSPIPSDNESEAEIMDDFLPNEGLMIWPLSNETSPAAISNSSPSGSPPHLRPLSTPSESPRVMNRFARPKTQLEIIMAAEIVALRAENAALRAELRIERETRGRLQVLVAAQEALIHAMEPARRSVQSDAGLAVTRFNKNSDQTLRVAEMRLISSERKALFAY